MTRAGQTVLLCLQLLAAVFLLTRAAAPPPALGPPGPASPCEIPVERAGLGVACLTVPEAAREGLVAGDRVEPDGRRARMAPARLALFDVPLDPNEATADELASLPGIGPGLAARLVAARPFRSPDDVRRVAGLGERRFQALRPRLRLRDRP